MSWNIPSGRLFLLGSGLWCLLAAPAGCTHGPCRDVKNPELADQQLSATVNPVVSMSPTPALSRASTVFVYKPDGSLQCGQGRAVSLQDMEKQLGSLRVLSRENRADGLMHIQVCGSPTGMINVYEIPAAALKDAEKRGFKKLEPR